MEVNKKVLQNSFQVLLTQQWLLMILVVFVKVVIKTYVVFYKCEECEDQKYKNHEHNFIKIRKKRKKRKLEIKLIKKKWKCRKKKQENNVQNSMFDDIKSQNYKNDLISKKNDNRIYHRRKWNRRILTWNGNRKKKKIQEEIRNYK